MRRIVLFVLPFVLACKKPPKEDPAPEGSAGPPKVGHSTTKVHGSDHRGSGSSTGEEPEDDDFSAGSAKPDTSDAKPGQVVGGNGAAPYRDDEGHVHGPGGPVFMGHGVDCDAAHDHCMRPDVWFSIANIAPGKAFRAVPVFLFEDKWWNFRSQEDTPVKLYKTKVAGKAAIAAGTPVIYFASESSEAKWVDDEYEALTSSRWESGVTESASTGSSVKISGGDTVPIDTVRVIVETKSR